MKKNAASKKSDNPGATQSVELLQRRWLSKNAFEIELTRPPDLVFKPGQTICFLHESSQKYYSLLSTPDDPTLSLCVFHVPEGLFSPILADAAIGTRFNISGAHGYFTFNPSERAPVFIATGTGIAPYVSMGRSGISGFIMLHEVDRAEDLYYQDLFRKLASNYIPCLLNPSGADPLPPGAFSGDAAGYIRDNLPPADYDFYLCGEREMTHAVTLLADERFPGSYVFKEVYF